MTGASSTSNEGIEGIDSSEENVTTRATRSLSGQLASMSATGLTLRETRSLFMDIEETPSVPTLYTPVRMVWKSVRSCSHEDTCEELLTKSLRVGEDNYGNLV